MLSSQPATPIEEKPANRQAHLLHSGEITCLYENGFVRYISSGNTELIRSIYPAVRDASWRTAPTVITSEFIEQMPDGFNIRYQADYALNDIRYTAIISISSLSGKNLVLSFSGEAGSDFLRNRIGLCALLPPDSLRGRKCEIGHPGGGRSNLIFPGLIQPLQPFSNIEKLKWETAGGLSIRMEFSGDVFEAEDQRNWGDASYKIYSTPHELPVPVAVEKGERVEQEIRISFENQNPRTAAPIHNSPIAFFTGGPSSPFPGIGYSYNPEVQTPDLETIRLLRRLSIDHYRVEIFLSGNWKQNWDENLITANSLNTKILVALYLEAAGNRDLLLAFLTEIKKDPEMILGLLLFSEQDPVSLQPNDERFHPVVSAALAGFRIGSGTDTFFAHWNQQPVMPEYHGAFITVPLSPLIHQPDTLTMVENLPAIADIIETMRDTSPAPAFIGPVTLKMRYNPDDKDSSGKPKRIPYAADDRQSSLLAAGWTAAALRYLCRADKITFFELTGPRGLVPDRSPEQGLSAIRVFPVYLLLREMAAFKPKNILLSRSLRPREADGLVLENIQGDRLMIFCNFSDTRQTLQLKTETWKTLPLFAKTMSPANVQALQEDGEKFRSAPYEPVTLSEGNGFRIAAGAVLFLTTLQDWSFS